MAKAACSSSRSQAIFDPFPTIIDPKDSTKLALSPEVGCLQYKSEIKYKFHFRIFNVVVMHQKCLSSLLIMLLEIVKAGTRKGNGKTSVDEIETTCVTTYLFSNKY